MKVVSLTEVAHTIEFQFEIMLEWSENRATYLTLKQKSSLNALSDNDIQLLWLPVVIYDNTDQKESTKLGEWSTRVTVAREGDLTRSEEDVMDEIEIFKGDENKLTMNQTYTKKFQCQYQLHRYPFDTVQ